MKVTCKGVYISRTRHHNDKFETQFPVVIDRISYTPKRQNAKERQQSEKTHISHFTLYWDLIYILCKLQQVISTYYVKVHYPKIQFSLIFALLGILHCPELQVKQLDIAQNTDVIRPNMTSAVYMYVDVKHQMK